MNTYYGTNHFPNLAAVVRYYGDRQTAIDKIATGAACIGKPPAKPGERVLLNRGEGRFFIEEGKP